MIEKIIITSLLVFAIWWLYLPGEIFGWFSKRLDAALPEYLRKPLYECPVCMAPWWGSAIFIELHWCGIWNTTWAEWPIIVLGAMGLNAIIIKLSPYGDGEHKGNSSEGGV